jgi:DNA-binding transcriptional LysR family regulator
VNSTRFTLRQLEAFVTVADEASFALASRRMGLTASAVSQLVAELEGILGLRLLERTTRRVSLSAPGGVFLGTARALLRQVADAEKIASDLRNRAAGIVRIGAPLVMASAILPLAVRAFRNNHANIVVHVRDAAVDDMIGKIVSGDIDLAVGPDRPPSDAVSRHVVFADPWTLWCAPDHALAKKKAVTWDELRQVPLVAAGRDHEVSVDKMRVDIPGGPSVVPLELVDNITTAFGIATTGSAATLAPRYVDLLARPFGLVMRPVTEPEVMRTICLYRPAARALSPAAETFHQFLAVWLSEWNARENSRVEP